MRCVGQSARRLDLTGSLVAGGYTDNVSDLDLVAVTARPLVGHEMRKLRALHARFTAAHRLWVDRVEVIYMPAR